MFSLPVFFTVKDIVLFFAFTIFDTLIDFKARLNSFDEKISMLSKYNPFKLPEKPL